MIARNEIWMDAAVIQQAFSQQSSSSSSSSSGVQFGFSRCGIWKPPRLAESLRPRDSWNSSKWLIFLGRWMAATVQFPLHKLFAETKHWMLSLYWSQEGETWSKCDRESHVININENEINLGYFHIFIFLSWVF